MFLSYGQDWVQGVQGVQMVQGVQEVQDVQEVQMVQDVQMVQGVQKVQGVQLSPIRGRKKGRVITGRGCREGETERECGHERFPPVRGKGLPEEDMGCPAPHTYMHLRYDMGEAPHAL